VSLLLLLMSVKMAPYWGKGGIMWLSYLLNESGDPDFFVWFYFKYIINSMPGKWEVSAHSQFGNNYCGTTLTFKLFYLKTSNESRNAH
jgi:hypothetical protein